MVFKVGDKVRFLEDFGSYRKGDVVEIVNKNVYRGEQTVDFKGKNGNGNTYITRIELVSNKQRIAVLESELSEVKNALAEQIKWNDEQKRVNDTVLKKLRLLFDNTNQVKPSTVVKESLTAATSVEDAPKRLTVGDIAKVIKEVPLTNTKIGDIVKIVHDAEDSQPYRCELLNGESAGYFRENELERYSDTVIEFEGAQYKKVDREAREGDVAILREPAEQTPYAKNNTPYKVVRGYNGKPYLIGSTVAYLYDGHFGRTPETVDVYELIVEDISPVEKSPNEKRAEIIEKAKKFIEDTKNNTGRLTGRKGYQYPNDDLAFLTDTDFVVNADKRTVVVLMRDQMNREIYKKGIAKCNPSDVFNEHIGKAIALGRALGLDVSEFENVVQPCELVVGQVCEIFDWDGHNGKHTKITRVFDGGKADHSYYAGWLDKNNLKIINDTNAKY